ncbi:MAG: helix-turn-helix domain-containing protein [Bacteroidota bacterium]
MYTLNDLQAEKTFITNDVFIYNLLQEGLIVPGNFAEVLIPLNGKMEVQMLGTMRKIPLERRGGYFVCPRGRAMKLFGNSSYLLIKCHPGYTKKIVKNLNELSRGIYQIDLADNMIDTLTTSVKNFDVFQVNDLLEKNFNLSRIKQNAVIIDAIDLIQVSFGSILIKDIYTELNISKSTLEQRFIKDIGLTPKEFCKIEKLNHFINTYRDNKEMNLTEITYQCGYYDQSHLIKDFNYFLGTSPKKYFK